MPIDATIENEAEKGGISQNLISWFPFPGL